MGCHDVDVSDGGAGLASGGEARRRHGPSVVEAIDRVVPAINRVTG